MPKAAARGPAQGRPAPLARPEPTGARNKAVSARRPDPERGAAGAELRGRPQPPGLLPVDTTVLNQPV
jgi:hypothetical protein